MMQHSFVTVHQSKAKGQVRVPTSKSIAHRALICAALCPVGERSVLSGVPYNEDIDATLDCLSSLGVNMEISPDPDDTSSRRVTVDGRGGNWTDGQDERGVLKCRESGSTLRFLLPLCLLSGEGRTLTGSQRLLQRPLDDYRPLFAEREWVQGEQSLQIGKGSILKQQAYRLAGNTSSQFVTGLLFVLPLLERDSTIELGKPPESRSYIDMTLAVMARFGVFAEWTDDRTLFVKGGQAYRSTDLTVDGDASGASFFFALGALGGDVRVLNAGGNIVQGDSVCLQLLQRMMQAEEGLAVISLADCPDLGPILFTVAAATEGAVFTHTARLRLKESDRVAAMVSELKKFGANIVTSDDFALVNSETRAALPSELTALGDGSGCGGWVAVLPCKEGLHAPDQMLDGHNDHRVVMSLSVLCSVIGDGRIGDACAVRKSFPRFFDCMRALGVKVTGDM